MTQPRVVVVGAGAAGLAAAIHAAWRGAAVTVLDPLGPGGQLQNVASIETLPGLAVTSGADLLGEMAKQVSELGVDMVFGAAVGIRHVDEAGFALVADDGRTFTADAVIVATGATSRPVGVPGEATFEHRGVSHCAACDGPLFRGKPVVVVGSGDAAADAALVLSQFCAPVTLIHRGPELRAAKALAARVDASDAIARLPDTELVSIDGDRAVESVTVQHRGDEPRTIETAAVFTAVGITIDNAAFADLLDVDADGRIVVDDRLAASVPGVFAAGSARSGSSDQLAAAIGDGVSAAVAALRWLDDEPATDADAGVVFATYEELYEHVADEGVSDGLPIVPLTAARLDRFAAEVADPDGSLGTLPDGSTVTVRDAIEYAVLAGCVPEHGPLVVASVQALLTDLDARRSVLADSLLAVVVNGPARLHVDLNCSDGLFGPGWRANATIGRAVRLFAVHRLGLPIATGFGDPGQYSLCFGEDEEKSPWTPLHVQRGLTPADSAVTVFSAPVYRQVMDRAHNDAAGIVDFINLFLRGRASGTSLFGDRPLSMLLVVGQELRRLLAPAYSKEQLRDELFERATADDGTPLAPVSLRSPDDLLIVAAGGVAFPTVWAFAAPHPAPPTIPLEAR